MVSQNVTETIITEENVSQQMQQEENLGFETIDNLQQMTQDTTQMNTQINQQMEQKKGKHSKTSKTSKTKSFFARMNPAADKDSGVEKKEKSITKKINGYQAVKNSDDFNGAMAKQMERNEVLLEMCEKEKNIRYATKDFQNVLQLIESYAKAKSYDAQQETLTKAINGISEYISKNQNPQDIHGYELLERIKVYSYYFDVNVNGSLQVNKEVAVQKNPDAGMLNTWKDVRSYKLFPHEPSVHDVKQRKTEDCYMLSSLSAIAYLDSEQIKQGVKDNGDGTVTVRFFSKDVQEHFYEDESLQDIYDQERKRKKPIVESEEDRLYREQVNREFDVEEIDETLEDRAFKVKVLTKLMSQYFQDEEFVEKCKEKIRSRTENNQVQDHDEETEFEELKLENIESDSMEDIIENDFELSPEESVQRMFDINNIDRYTSILNECFQAGKEMSVLLNQVMDQLSQSTESEQVEEVMSQFFQQLAEQEKYRTELDAYRKLADKANIPEKIMRPVYVRVTKEISSIAGGVELNATDSLWVQMIEKAYAQRFRSDVNTNKPLHTYEAINTGQSAEFLRRFLNQDYEKRDIYEKGYHDIIDEKGQTILSAKEIATFVYKARTTKNQIEPDISDILAEIQKDKSYGIMGEAEERVKEELKKLGFLSDELKSIITKDSLQSFIKSAEQMKADGAKTIETIMQLVLKKPEYAALDEEKQKMIIQYLEGQGIMHEVFSGTYSSIANAFYNDTLDRLEKREVITVGVKTDSLTKERKKALNDTGIRTGHAYAVIRCFESEGHKFVTLRDPYGLFRRKYDVTQRDGKIVKFEKKDDSSISLSGTDTMGMFNMELNDFLSTFDFYSGILAY